MDFLVVIRVALKVLSDKLVAIFSLALAAFLSGWVMYSPDPLRVVALGIFALFALLIGRKVEENAKDQPATARVESTD